MTQMCNHCCEDYSGIDCPKCGSMEIACGNCEGEVSCDKDGKPHDTSGDGGGALFAPGTPAEAVWCAECLDNYDGAPDEVDTAATSGDEKLDEAWKAKRG